MTNNSGNKLVLAAALSLLGASLGVSAAQAANSDATSTPNKVELAALFLKHNATSTQIEGETTSTQIKGETHANFLKGAATSNQGKLNQSNQIKFWKPGVSNQLKLDSAHSNQIKLDSNR